jgi:hypothetical protein
MTTRYQSRKAEPSRRHQGHEGQPSMTARQLEAYLLSRDALRRIQRSSALFGEVHPSRVMQRSTH